MNFIRGSLLVLVSTLLLISFLVLGIFATLNFSLRYENVKPQINSFISEFVKKEVSQEVINEQAKILQTSCKTNSNYSFNDETTNYTFVIPCETIAKGTDEIINKESALLIDEYYYKKYECGFLECFNEQKSPWFIVSQHAKDFWKKQFYIIFIVSVLLMSLIYLLMERKNNFTILIGSLLISGFLPLLALSGISKFAVSSFASDFPLDLNSMILIFFGKAINVFWTGFVTGIILIIFGIFLKLLKVGIEVEEWLEKKGEK